MNTNCNTNTNPNPTGNNTNKYIPPRRLRFQTTAESGDIEEKIAGFLKTMNSEMLRKVTYGTTRRIIKWS